MQSNDALDYDQILEKSNEKLNGQIKSIIKDLLRQSGELAEQYKAEKEKIKEVDDELETSLRLVYSCVTYLEKFDIYKEYTIEKHGKILKINIVMNCQLAIIKNINQAFKTIVKNIKSSIKKIIKYCWAKLIQLSKLIEITISGGTGTMLFGLINANIGLTFGI